MPLENRSGSWNRTNVGDLILGIHTFVLGIAAWHVHVRTRSTKPFSTHTLLDFESPPTVVSVADLALSMNAALLV
jgi:hypothetical protein